MNDYSGTIVYPDKYYYINKKKPFKNSKITFVFRAADPKNTTAEVAGYRIALYAENNGTAERVTDLHLASYSSWVSIDHAEYHAYELCHGINDATNNGLIHVDVTDTTLIGPSLSGKYLFTDSNTTTPTEVNFFDDFVEKYPSEKWLAVTVDLNSFYSNKATWLTDDTKIYIRACAYIKDGKDKKYYSIWSMDTSNWTIKTEGVASAEVQLEKFTAVLQVNTDTGWQEGLIHVYDGSNWVEAEGLLVYDGKQWVEAIV